MRPQWKEVVRARDKVLLYGNETMLWREKEMYTIRAGQIDNLRALLGIMRRDRVPNAQFRKMCGVAKRVDERIGDVVLL